VPIATCRSIRASGAPMQWCAPCPKARCDRSGVRVASDPTVHAAAGA
jgi:hypothetical protein